jgi:hypothetical protein
LFLPSCIPAFLISSWVAASCQCAVDGIRVSRPGAAGRFAVKFVFNGKQERTESENLALFSLFVPLLYPCFFRVRSVALVDSVPAHGRAGYFVVNRRVIRG